MIKKFIIACAAFSFVLLQAAVINMPKSGQIIVPAAKGTLNQKNVEVVANGVMIRKNGKSAADIKSAEPDVVFSFKCDKPGLYSITSVAAVDETGAKMMKDAMKKRHSVNYSMTAQLQVNDQRATKRYIFVPWGNPKKNVQSLGKFQFGANENVLKIWLPEHTMLQTLHVKRYAPPAPPRAYRNYQPRYVPPKVHPRLWIHAKDVDKVRSKLDDPEHIYYWEKVRNAALRKFKITFVPGAEMTGNTDLENAAYYKAFYYMMTEDRRIGREAVDLVYNYLQQVEFGNALDVARKIGSVLHTAACVYDWCYDLISAEEKSVMRQNMLRLARDMECGWPPFAQPVVNGHGSEMQINRDLLSMGIAIYDEDPEPYRYCAYRILEELVAMRNFEYRSPRHNQGVSYGAYRYPCDIRAALLFRQMLGVEIFDKNFKNVVDFFFYMRAPNGTMLADGDGNLGRMYWFCTNLTFYGLMYTRNPMLKGEYLRQKPKVYTDWVLFLLLNDPSVKVEESYASLPLTKDFGEVLPSMVARTGWEIGKNSPDVVAEIKGGGYLFGNHQHAESGSFQIYYRGFLAAKLGQYHFYGRPYDMNFAKRSISRSMMLVYDPSEKFWNTIGNDGGSRFTQRLPLTPADLQKPEFRYGKKLYCSFGPSAQRPLYSSFAADLTEAYSKKIKKFVRSFHFFNMGRKDVPAVMIVADDITTSKAEFRKYWQINTIYPPKLTADGVILTSKWHDEPVGKLHLSMPYPEQKVVDVKSGKDTFNVFGLQLEPVLPDRPEAKGHRILFSPARAAESDRFLAVMQVTEENAAPLPVRHSKTPYSYVVEFGDRAVSVNSGTALINKEFSMTVTLDGEVKIMAAGVAPGTWTVKTPGKSYLVTVEKGKNCIFLTGGKGVYTFIPGAVKGAEKLPDYSKMEAPVVKK